MKLILPVTLIPPNTTVSRPTGTKEYILMHELVLHQDGGEKKEINLGDCVALIGSSGICMLGRDQLMAVSFEDIDEVLEFVETIIGEEDG